MHTIVEIDLRAPLWETVQRTLGELLDGVLSEARLMEGLLRGVVAVLTEIARAPESPRSVPVEVDVRPDCVELRLTRGSVVESLLAYP
jgi:hypothetical protein